MSSNRISAFAREADETLHGVHVPRVGSDGISPEQSLFRSVVVMAWHDAFVHSDWVLVNGKSRGPEDRAVTGDIERGRARRWLTFNHGRWREDRELICDLAGMSPELLRKLAIAKWAQVKEEGKPKEPVDRDALAKRARVDLDKMMEQLLSRTGELSHEDVDLLLEDLAETECENMLAAAE